MHCELQWEKKRRLFTFSSFGLFITFKLKIVDNFSANFSARLKNIPIFSIVKFVTQPNL